MNYDGYFERLKHQMAERYGQPVEAALMVHPAKDGGFPKGNLKANNVLVLTPTHLRICALGGRSGIKPKAEAAEWVRGQVVIDPSTTVHRTFMRTTMSWYQYDLY